MARGPGVSTDRQPNGRWRVRWREKVREGEHVRTVQRSQTVEDQATATIVAAQVLRALETGELYERDAVREVPVVASLDAVLDGWLEACTAKGLALGSLDTYAAYVGRILLAFRELEGLSPDEQVPGTVLSRPGAIMLTNKLRADGMAPSSVHWVVRAFVAAWVWACDDTETYAGITPAPRDTSALLPRAPSYWAPPAPTMAEIDAVIRRLANNKRASRLVPALVVARCTGLRIGQVQALTVADADLEQGRLRISTGKSAREKGGRTVPMAPVLARYLSTRVAGRAAEEPLVEAGEARRYVTSAWKLATSAGEAREEVWKPPAHKKARPDHAFRAAFQDHLVRLRVHDEVIDALVGHGEGVRSRHYVDDDARWEAMVEAVSTIPAIAWKKPSAL